MRKELWLVIILLLVIVVLTGVLVFWPKPAPNNQTPGSESSLQVDFPKANQEISSPVKITGKTNGGDWNGFEGQVGVAKLLDENGKQIGLAILTATTDWMSPPVSFETYLQFSSDKDQNGKLVFSNENPSGSPEKSKEFTLPVKIKKGSGELMTVEAFFNNSKMDPEASCNKVFPVQRQVPKTDATGTAALNELFKGPTEAEKNAGFFTSINNGVKLQSLIIDSGSGIARADFDEQLEYQVGGSCRVSAIRAQITQTLKQFPTVKSVIISINGRTEDILQP